MGSISRVFKKVTRAVTKPISKAFKGVAKGIMKVGKATMRGIAKVQNKLGPLGSIALAIAMPYALGGLGTLTNTAMSSANPFLKAIGTVGNSIRTGYQAFNTGISKGFSTITKSISQGFRKFAPKGMQNMFSEISRGAKTLYNSAKTTMKKYTPKPLTSKVGNVEVFDSGRFTGGAVDPGVNVISSIDAASALGNNTLLPSELGKQTLTKGGGWFTKINEIGVQSDNVVRETINNAYKERLKGFGPNAMTMFNDSVDKAKQLGTYINDEQIGSFVENSSATNRYLSEVPGSDYGVGTGKPQINTEISDLQKTGDYFDNGQGGLRYTGENTFKAEPVKNASSELLKNAKNAVMKNFKSLLKPSETKIDPYYMGQKDMTMQTGMTGYSGTDIVGSGGGDFITKVYGTDAANKMRTYYKNMNLLDGGSF
jgi:hypothetical protein